MKRILFNITLLLLVSYSGVSFSQIRKLKPIDEFLIKEGIDDLLVFRGGPCGVTLGGVPIPCSEDVKDFTFTSGSSFDNTLANHNSIVRAAAISHRNWFNDQKDIMKKHLENKFGQNFSNYDVAKNKMFFHSEVKNLARVSIPVRAKYSTLRSNGFSKQRIHKKELKLLKYREAEIKAGNINNSIYANVKVGNTYLKDIKDLNTIKSKWNPLVADFSKNTATTHINNYIYKEVGLHNNDLIAGVVNLKNNYYNRFNDWDKLDLVQFLINFEQIKNLSQNYVLLASSDARLLMDKYSGAYQSNEKMVEDSAIKNRKGGYSIFDNWWIGYYAHHYPLAGQPNYEYGAYVVNELRTKRLNELLGETSIGANASVDFIVERFHISDKYQLIWLNDNPAKAIEIKNVLGNNPTTSNPTFISNVLPQLQNGAIIAKFLEGASISNNLHRKFLYDNPNLSKKLSDFADANRVNGVISEGAKKFIKSTVEVDRILNNQFRLKSTGKFPQELDACCPGGCCPDSSIYNDDKIIKEYGIEPMQNAIDGSFNFLVATTELIGSEEWVGSRVRSIMTEVGVNIPADVNNEYLAAVYRIRKRDGILIVEYRPGLLRAMLDVGLDTLDMISFLSPSRGGGAFLAIKAGGKITITKITAHIRKITINNTKINDAIRSIQNNATFDLAGTGTYNAVRGHHPLAKSAFRGDKFYKYRQAFSVSANSLGGQAIHNAITGHQNRLYSAFKRTGEVLTLNKMAEIEIQAMVDAGIPRNIATGWVIKSLESLKEQGVKMITNIPWNGLN